MQLLDRDIHLARALIIDANPTARSVLAGQLRDLGVQQVRQMSRVQDARTVLEEAPHDIVLCEMNFEGAAMSGQDLLDELRREQLLPYSTAFILVTGDASYAQVQEAAEATVDGFLVKPCSGLALAERLTEVRRRKRTLKAIYEAIQARELLRAAALAEQRFVARDSYWSFAAQLAAELWLRTDQPQRALKIYQTLIETRPTAWARVGVARVYLATGDLPAARRLLDELVMQSPEYADAHDLLACVAVEQGDFAAALTAFRQAANLTPGCLLRMQHLGALAFYQGQKDEAVQQLERTLALGRRSKLFDLGCLLLLGLLKFDLRDARGLVTVTEQVLALSEADPASTRLRRVRRMLGGLSAVLKQRPDDALGVARELAAEVMAPDFDLEAAALTISLWARLRSGEVPLKEFDTLLRAAGLRFAVSKAAIEMLVAATDDQAPAIETLRNCAAVINNIAEQAMSRSAAGQAAQAVEMLLDQGEHTRNARLLEMAGAVTRRHAEHLADAAALQARVTVLQEGWCAPLTHIAGVRRSARAPGGVVLRT